MSTVFYLPFFSYLVLSFVIEYTWGYLLGDGSWVVAVMVAQLTAIWMSLFLYIES